MKKVVKDKIIFVEKQKVSFIPFLLSGASLFFILLGAASLIFLQKPIIEQQYDTRGQASVENGKVLVTSVLTSGTDFVANQASHIDLKVDTKGIQTYGVEVLLNITSTSETVEIDVPATLNLQVLKQEIEKTADGHLVSLAVAPKEPGQPFSTSSPTTFATLHLNLKKASKVGLFFDEYYSLATVYGSNPPVDELKIIPSTVFIIGTPESNPPCVARPACLDARPACKIAIPAGGFCDPTPTPTPSSSTVKSCNQSCSSSADCDVNLRCYEGVCRRATYVTSTSCAEPPDRGIHRSCNEYCADTNECSSGYTCFFNRCRKPENPDSTTCATLTQSGTQSIAKSCNTSCSSNADCAVNLRCYSGKCRLATNVGSLSCSPYTAPVVSSTYGQKGDDVEEGTGSSSGSGTTSSPTASPKSSAQPTPSGSPRVSATPFPSVMPTPKATPAAPSDEGSSTSVFPSLPSFSGIGFSLPILAIGSGVVLFLIALFMFLSSLFRKSGNNTPAQNMSATKQPTQYEDELQKRINELKQKAPAAPAPIKEPTAAPVAPQMPVQGSKPAETPLKENQPVKPMEVKKVQPEAPKASPGAAPSVQQPQVKPQTEQPEVSGSSMMQKLKQKGLMNNGTAQVPPNQAGKVK